jgi:ABC-2 type transport system permease protein
MTLKMLFNRKSDFGVLLIFIRNNILEYLRDFTSTFFTFVFPLIFVVIFSLTGSSKSSPPNMSVKVVGDIYHPQALELIEALNKVPAITVSWFEVKGEKAARSQLNYSTSSVVWFNAKENEGIKVWVFGWKGVKRYIETAFLAASTTEQSELYQHKIYSDFTFEFVEPEHSVVLQMLPAFFAMALLQIGLFGTSAPLLQQRSSGVLRHLLILPLPATTLIASLLSVRLLMACAQMLGMYIICTIFLGLEVQGSMLMFVVYLVSGTLCFVSMGFAIGGFISNAQVGMFVNLLLNFLMLGFGGVFIPTELSGWAGVISDMLPISYLVEGLQLTVFGGKSDSSSLVNISILLGWSVVLVIFSIKTFRYDLNKKL